MIAGIPLLQLKTKTYKRSNRKHGCSVAIGKTRVLLFLPFLITSGNFMVPITLEALSSETYWK